MTATAQECPLCPGTTLSSENSSDLYCGQCGRSWYPTSEGLASRSMRVRVTKLPETGDTYDAVVQTMREFWPAGKAQARKRLTIRPDWCRLDRYPREVRLAVRTVKRAQRVLSEIAYEAQCDEALSHSEAWRDFYFRWQERRRQALRYLRRHVRGVRVRWLLSAPDPNGAP